MDMQTRERVEAIQERCEALLGAHRVQQDRRARYNHAQRVREGTAMLGSTADLDFMRPGDVVSYKGDKWLLLECVGPSADQPVDALIESIPHGLRKKVTFDQLRAVAIDRPVLVAPDTHPDYEACDLVVYGVGGENRLGLVLMVRVGERRLVVQCLEGRKGKRAATWLPVWIREGESVRALRRPSLGAPATEEVCFDEVAAVVALDGNHCLTSKSVRLLDARGFAV